MLPHHRIQERTRRPARAAPRAAVFRARRIRTTLAWLALLIISLPAAMTGQHDSTSQALDEAMQSIRAGRASDASAQLETLLETQPTSAVLHHYLGLAYEKQGRHEAAARSLERALELEPGRAAALAPLAWSQFYLGRSDAARTNFRRYLQSAPGDPGARLGLGLVEAEDGQPERARLHFLETIQLAHARGDEESEALARSALADVELRDGNLLTAVRLLEAATRLRPTDSALRLKLAHALDLAGDPEGAAAARAIHAQPSTETAPR